MSFKHYIFLFLMYWTSFNINLNAQNLNVDSCIAILKNSKEDTNKVILLNKIAWNIGYTNLQKGLEYSKQSYDLAKKIKFEKYLPRICNTQGSLYIDLAEIPKALNLFLEGLTYAKKYNLYSNQAALYNSLGNLYDQQNEFKQALAYYFKCLEILNKYKINRSTAFVSINIANIYLEFNKLDSALYFANTALKESKKANDINLLTNSYNSISSIYFQLNKKTSCLNNALLAIKYAEENKDDYTLSYTYISLGKAHFINNDINQAINAILKGKEYANKTGDISALELATQLLSDYYEKNNDYNNSLIFLKEYKSYKDSSLNEESIKQIKNAEAKYENEKKQREIELLGEKQKVNEVENQKKKLYLYIALFGIVILTIVLTLLFRNNKSKQKLNKNLELFNQEINFQKELVEHKNKEVTDSIMYAQRIQQSILTSDNYFKKNTNDYFILFKPKDIVSGDFYWALNHNQKFILMNADCTGHGVPGAMMSMMGINFLNEIVNEKMIEKPSEILNQLRKDIIKTLNPEDSTDERKDGMDCSLLSIDYNAMQVTYSTANNSFYIIRNNELIVSNTNKMPVGIGHSAIENFKDWTIDLQKNDIIITLTDGYADQFGGPKGKKFKYKPLENLLLTNAHLPLSEIKNKLSECIDTWKGNLEQVDDICIVGIKI